MRYVYLPVPGSHLSKEDAAIIGETLAELSKRHPDGFGSDDFLKTIRNPRHKAHPIFLKHRRRMVRGLDAEVAKYLRLNVDIIEITVQPDGSERESAAMPVTRMYSFASEGERETRTFLSTQVMSQADLLEREELIVLGKVERIMSDFVTLCGGKTERAWSILQRVTNEVRGAIGLQGIG